MSGPTLLVLGPPGAGKTTYLAALYGEFLLGRVVDAGVEPDRESARYLASQVAALEKTRTPVRATIETRLMRWRLRLPGEAEPVDLLVPEYPGSILPSAAPDGLVVLVPPREPVVRCRELYEDGEPLLARVQEVAAAFERAGGRKIPVALVLVQADLAGLELSKDATEAARCYLESRFPPLVEACRNRASEIAFFAASSYGTTPADRPHEPPDSIRPFGVVASFLWAARRAAAPPPSPSERSLGAWFARHRAKFAWMGGGTVLLLAAHWIGRAAFEREGPGEAEARILPSTEDRAGEIHALKTEIGELSRRVDRLAELARVKDEWEQLLEGIEKDIAENRQGEARRKSEEFRSRHWRDWAALTSGDSPNHSLATQRLREFREKLRGLPRAGELLAPCLREADRCLEDEFQKRNWRPFREGGWFHQVQVERIRVHEDCDAMREKDGSAKLSISINGQVEYHREDFDSKDREESGWYEYSFDDKGAIENLHIPLGEETVISVRKHNTWGVSEAKQWIRGPTEFFSPKNGPLGSPEKELRLLCEDHGTYDHVRMELYFLEHDLYVLAPDPR
ncbi:MAG: hypothetical protein HY720_04690 [Planctomycetes bacterium]|nr:hypothetical protein [Planctomycetota bacterium]